MERLKQREKQVDLPMLMVALQAVVLSLCYIQEPIR